MADNNEFQYNTQGPTVSGTLGAVSSLQTKATGEYANYLNSIYQAGRNLQDTGQSLVNNTTTQFNQLKKQSQQLFKTNPGASRQEQMEMTNALNESLNQFGANTINNREIMQDNTQSWFQSIGNLLTDTSTAKFLGETFYAGLDGSKKEKYKATNDVINSLNSSPESIAYWDVFFDESEVEKIRESAEDNEYGFFSEDWVDAFTTSEYDKMDKRMNRGLVRTTLFGGPFRSYDLSGGFVSDAFNVLTTGIWNSAAAFGDVLNFALWEPMQFMTVDLVNNSWNFVSSIFNPDEGIDWGAGLGAGLAIGSWVLFISSAGASGAATSTIAEEVILTDIDTAIEGKMLTTVSEDVFSSLADDAAKVLDDSFTQLFDDASSSIKNIQIGEETLEQTLTRSLGSEAELEKIGERLLTDRTNLLREIEIGAGKEAATLAEKEIATLAEKATTEALKHIKDSGINNLSDLNKIINLEKFVGTKSSKRMLSKANLNSINKIKRTAGRDFAAELEAESIAATASEDVVVNKVEATANEFADTTAGDGIVMEGTGEEALEGTGEILDNVIDEEEKIKEGVKNVVENSDNPSLGDNLKANKEAEQIKKAQGRFKNFMSSTKNVLPGWGKKILKGSVSNAAIYGNLADTLTRGTVRGLYSAFNEDEQFRVADYLLDSLFVFGADENVLNYDYDVSDGRFGFLFDEDKENLFGQSSPIAPSSTSVMSTNSIVDQTANDISRKLVLSSFRTKL